VEPVDTNGQRNATSFEHRLPGMLANLADAMPASVGLADRVEQRLASQALASAPDAGGQRWRIAFSPIEAHGLNRWLASAISLLVVIALIVGFFAILHMQRPIGAPMRQRGPCTQVTINSTPCTLHDAHATISVSEVYADPTRISIGLHVTLTNARIPYGNPIQHSQPVDFTLMNFSLHDAQGHPFTWVFASATQRFPQNAFDVTYFFAPLALSQLGGRQSLTLAIHRLLLIGAPGYAFIDGNWTLHIRAVPQGGRVIPLSIAPVTHHGVTVQPIRLDVAPDETAFDGFRGGERLIVKVSGLPAKMSLSEVAAFSAQISYPDGGSGDSQLATSLLFERQEPAYVTIAGYDPTSSQNPTVGSSGAVTLEVIFIGPPLPNLTGVQSLYINQFGTPGYNYPPIPGPWEIQIPLG